MWWRVGFWVVGMTVGGLLAWSIGPEPSTGAMVLAFGASVLLAALFGELAQALGAAQAAGVPGPPPGALPADGRVDLVEVAGALGVPNARDPRFSAFATLEPAEAAGRAALPRGRAAPPLLGRVAVISVFLGRDRRPWSDAEVAEAHAALIRAGEWIEREAMRWQAPVNVVLPTTYFVVDDDEPAGEVEMTFVAEGESYGPFEARAVTKALIDTSRAASRLGFRDAVDWMAQVNPRIAADARVWLLHPRRAGRSLAVPLDQTELAGVSLAVCYAREANFPEPLTGHPFTDPVTIVHELLHLFGASDKYGVSLRRFPPRSVSSRDVMRLSEERLSRLRVDAMTAREIGWGGPDPVGPSGEEPANRSGQPGGDCR